MGDARSLAHGLYVALSAASSWRGVWASYPIRVWLLVGKGVVDAC